MSSSALFIQSIEKGLLALEAFRHQETMNLQEMARAAGISTSSAQRVAHTLAQLGYIRKDAQSRRYALTPRSLALGYGYLLNEPLFRNAHPVLLRLNQECGESVNFSVPDGDDMVFVLRIHTHKHIPVYMPTGTRIPMLSSASGRACLASLPPGEFAERLARMEVARHTPMTTRDKTQLRRLVEEARASGYAWADEEYFKTDVNVAAAVLDEDGRPRAAVNISVPKPRWTLERAREELGPLALRAAHAIGPGRP